MKSKIRFLTQSAVIAAIYIVLTFISAWFGLSGGAVQLRLSEALCILPVFTPAAIPGLFVGCFASNIMTGCIFLDIVFGSIATLAGAVFTRWLRRFKLLPFLPPILSNTIVLPFVLKYAYAFDGSYIWFLITVFLGEFLSCGVLGYLFKNLIKKYRIYF